MKVMIVGGGGLLGQKLIEVFRRETDDQLLSVIRSGIADANGAAFFDTASRAEWKKITLQERWKPDVIVNAADATPTGDESVAREQLWRARVTTVELLVDVCRRIDARIVQVSCDSVFDERHGPYTEAAIPQPLTYEGRAKLAAENICRRTGVQHTIVRTMWLYGAADGKSPLLVRAVERALSESRPLELDANYTGTPTLTDDVAYAIVRAIETKFEGVVHVAGPDLVSQCDFARHLAAAATRNLGAQPIIRPLSTETPPRRSGLISLYATTRLHIKPQGIRTGLETYYVQRDRRVRPAGR